MRYTTEMIKNYVVNVGRPPQSIDSFLKSLGCKNIVQRYPNNYYQALYSIVLSLKPNVMIETGVQNGHSSYAILDAMTELQHGKLISIDIDLCKDNIVTSKLSKRWEFHQGSTLDILEDLIKKEGTIDIFLHDSKHDLNTMYYEYSVAWSHIKQNGLLLSHDIARNKAFRGFAKYKQRQFYYMWGNFAGMRK